MGRLCGIAEFAPAATFLGTEDVNRNPSHVTYVYNPTMDFSSDGTTAGHAYWVFGVGVRDASGSAPLGTIDVRSAGGPPPFRRLLLASAARPADLSRSG